jgi:putative oxidoreductase
MTSSGPTDPASKRQSSLFAGRGRHERSAMNRLLALGATAASLAERIGHVFRWLSPTIARLTVGLVFFPSGWGKLHDLEKVTDYFTTLGLPAPAFQARLASSAEFVCGGLLLLGVATRFATVPLIITMCVAIRTALWDQVDGISRLVGLTEFAYIALLIWLATDGPGPLSLDRLLTRRNEHLDGGRMPAGTAPSHATT